MPGEGLPLFMGMTYFGLRPVVAIPSGPLRVPSAVRLWRTGCVTWPGV